MAALNSRKRLRWNIIRVVLLILFALFFFVPLGDLLERRRIVLTLAYACCVLLAGMALAAATA